MGASLMMVGDNEVGVIGFVVSRHLLYPVFFPLTWSFLRPAPRALGYTKGAWICPQLEALACSWWLCVKILISLLMWCYCAFPGEALATSPAPQQSSLLLCGVSLPHPAQLLLQARGRLDFSVCFALVTSP